MILIADSGSTKCDWALVAANGKVNEVATVGFNPYFHTSDSITKALQESEGLMQHAQEISKVFFYGAGCSSDAMNEVVAMALRTVFPKAEVSVAHDVLGAALAACQGKEGIACILGTGSNSCYYDGKDTSEVLPSLGFVLGDEGSGSWYGKQVLRDYLYNESIPTGLRQELEQQGHTKDSILEATLRKPHVNVYLASFMKTVSKFKETDYVKGLLQEGMRSFLTRHVCCFENFKEVPTSFVGSVAFYHQEALNEEAGKLGIRTGNVICKPIDGLVVFHSAG